MFRILLLLSLAMEVYSATGEFGYGPDNGPDHWSGMCKDGEEQSPIDIKPSEAQVTCNINDFTFSPSYSKAITDMTMVNTGTTVKLSSKSENLPSVNGGGLEAPYTFLQLHFHWGADRVKGSEHQLDEFSFPLELHIVHVREQIKGQRNFLAVLGIFFQEVEDDDVRANKAMTQIADKLNAIKPAADSTSFPSLTLMDLLPGNKEVFYRYEGSLTTPTCDQAVRWTVFAEHLYIGKTALAAFRNVLDKKSAPLVDNFRPPMPVNSRKVQFRIKSNNCKELQKSSSGLVPSLLAVISALLVAYFH